MQTHANDTTTTTHNANATTIAEHWRIRRPALYEPWGRYLAISIRVLVAGTGVTIKYPASVGINVS
jgi:hypothetical protein